MTCAVMTPWWRSRRAAAQDEASGDVAATAVLDTGSAAVLALADVVRALAGERGDRVLLQQAHCLIGGAVRPVYAVEELQPASVTLLRGRGSCSQRLAVLEAVARSQGIATRCRGLLVDGAFWYPRFPRLRRLVPHAVVLAWPEFHLEQRWVPVAELFGPVNPRADSFTNTGPETLFDAIARRAVDWDGVSFCPTGDCGELVNGQGLGTSAAVLTDLGRFTSRDELFAAYGQTLCRPARMVADPVLSRFSAGSPARTEPRRGS